MGRPDLKTGIVHRVICGSFDHPGSFPGLVEKEVTRNRALSSADRRELGNLLHDAVRWRRRVWGDIAPTTIDLEQSVKRLSEARALKDQPPMARWNGQSMEALARELSFPTWMIEAWVRQFGLASTVSLALALNEPAPVTLRVNTLKSDRTGLLAAFSKEGVSAAEGKHSPWAVHLMERKNLRSLKSFKRGWFEVQDEASQVAVLAADVKPGEHVIDVCTGAGGKALAVAAAMKNRGKIFAVDSDSRGFSELMARAKRAGVTILETGWVAADDPNPYPAMEGRADVVFLDAPCSSLGTLRRHPWSKWSLPPAAAETFPKKQMALLTRFARWVRPGGRLVYATCTLSHRENEGLVEAYLEADLAFALRGEPRLLRPDVDGTDGFFTALLERRT